MSNPSLKAYSYLRVSGKGQLSGDGFTRQRETISAYAKAKGYSIAAEYQEQGVSGTKELSNRQALAALLAAVESNGVKVIIVERADRLARDLIVSELILQDFRKAGVAVIAADCGEDLTAVDADPSKVLIRQILSAVAQYDKSVTVLKLRKARERIRASGRRCEGRKPFGARPDEQTILGRLRALSGQGMSLRQIAASLNREGLKTRQGRDWRAGTVGGILSRSSAARLSNFSCA